MKIRFKKGNKIPSIGSILSFVKGIHTDIEFNIEDCGGTYKLSAKGNKDGQDKYGFVSKDDLLLYKNEWEIIEEKEEKNSLSDLIYIPLGNKESILVNDLKSALKKFFDFFENIESETIIDIHQEAKKYFGDKLVE